MEKYQMKLAQEQCAECIIGCCSRHIDVMYSV